MKNINKNIAKISKIVGSNILFKKILEDILPDGEKVPMKQGKRKMILAVAQQDEGIKQLLNSSSQKVRDLIQARLAVKSWKLHIKRIQNLINQAKARNGFLGIPLSYYSAHTGRFGGSEGLNVQNFGKRGRTGSGIHPLIKEVGGLIEAPEGYTFITPDLSQIEARMLAWFAGQDDLLKSFARGEDVYSEFATTLFNSKVYKPDEDDPEPIVKLLEIRRGFGKDAILGCGYGMGTNRFYQNCRENSNLRPLFDSGKYDWEFIDNLIKTYRKKYSKIIEFWTFCEKAFRWVTKYPNEVVTYPEKDISKSPNSTLKVWDYTGDFKLAFWNENGTVFIRLPSGRELRYRNARIIKDRYKGTIAWRWGKLWGGSIVENIVQAASRDILAEAILLIEPFNPIICHVHDSITVMVKKDNAKFARPKIEKAMRTIPEWAKGMPIDVESVVKETF